MKRHQQLTPQMPQGLGRGSTASAGHSPGKMQHSSSWRVNRCILGAACAFLVALLAVLWQSSMASNALRHARQHAEWAQGRVSGAASGMFGWICGIRSAVVQVVRSGMAQCAAGRPSQRTLDSAYADLERQLAVCSPIDIPASPHGAL